MNSHNHIMIVAGEASGDLHAAHLIKELKKLNASLSFSGLGGNQLRKEGVEIIDDLTKIAVVGFWEVLKHYDEIKKSFHLFLKEVKQKKPLCVILVDYPGFNLRLAKELKKLDVKVIYYISPQVWAWKENRVAQIKRDVDKMLVLFSFEKDFYAKRGIEVSFVGHPLVDIVSPQKNKQAFLDATGLVDYRLTIGLLPGSRLKEVERHLPSMIEAGNILYKDYPMLQFLIIKAPTIERKLIDEIVDLYRPTFPLKVIDHDNYDAMNACDICMVTSGTATLETAVLGKPMVIIYKTSLFTFLLAKMLVKIHSIGLVNIVAQKKIVPECIQSAAKPSRIADEIKKIFTNEIRVAEIKDELRKVKQALGDSGASHKAALEVLKTISG